MDSISWRAQRRSGGSGVNVHFQLHCTYCHASGAAHNVTVCDTMRFSTRRQTCTLPAHLSLLSLSTRFAVHVSRPFLWLQFYRSMVSWSYMQTHFSMTTHHHFCRLGSREVDWQPVFQFGLQVSLRSGRSTLYQEGGEVLREWMLRAWQMMVLVLHASEGFLDLAFLLFSHPAHASFVRPVQQLHEDVGLVSQPHQRPTFLVVDSDIESAGGIWLGRMR